MTSNHPEDLVARLLDGASRTWLGSLPYDIYGPIMAEAAWRLTALEAEVAGLRAALGFYGEAWHFDIDNQLIPNAELLQDAGHRARALPNDRSGS